MSFKCIKLFSLLIAAVLTLTGLSSCGGSADKNIDAQTAGNDETTALTEETTTEPAEQL
ncbi:MAG: hypothetical protein GX827_05765 [Clostridiales bacterium]|jgi:hypothetical protein|nr:hypothetical protein [Clostridiales bacterium]